MVRLRFHTTIRPKKSQSMEQHILIGSQMLQMERLRARLGHHQKRKNIQSNCKTVFPPNKFSHQPLALFHISRMPTIRITNALPDRHPLDIDFLQF
jgi:hypothetical protein